MATLELSDAVTVPCCPPLGNDCPRDQLDFHYRQLHSTLVTVNDQRRPVVVEVTILGTGGIVAAAVLVPPLDPLPVAVQEQALRQVNEDLLKAGLLTGVGGVMREAAVADSDRRPGGAARSLAHHLDAA